MGIPLQKISRRLLVVSVGLLLAGAWMVHRGATSETPVKPSFGEDNLTPMIARPNTKNANPPATFAAASGLPANIATTGLADYEVFAEQSVKILQAAGDMRKSGSRASVVNQLAALEALQEKQVAARATALGFPVQKKRLDGELQVLVGFNDREPIYTEPQNADAAVATGAAYVRQNSTFDSVFGPGIDGAGLGAGVFELGSVYAHEEFALPDGTSRVVALTTSEPTGHGSHVGGTIGAKGLDPEAKGMAPAVTIYSWYQEGASKYAARAIAYPGEAGRMVVTNTSLGSTGDGRYAASDRDRDAWALLFPYTIMFQCAGNAGSDFETLNGVTKEAKNHFTVGSVVDVSRNTAGVITGGGGIVASSSRGPTDDGRIKPEIVANGNSLYSIGSTAGSYGRRSGTSMSTPNATGSAVLLQDYFSKRFPGHLMRADTLKGLIIHAADDLGRVGPDYSYGYGLLNVHAAAKIIKSYADRPASRQLSHAILKQGETHTRTLSWDGASPLRVTLAWLDPVGPASKFDDDRTPALVNDLDVTLTAPSGAVHRPWVMPYVLNGFNAADRAAPAIRGDNTVDNAELIVVEAPTEAGVYTITVKHKGTLSGGEQSYSLIHSGFSTAGSAPAPTMTAWSDIGEGWYEVNGTNFMLGARVVLMNGPVELATGTGPQVAASRIVAHFDQAPTSAASLVVINPDGQATVASIVPPTGTGIALTASEATWSYTQNFDSLTRSTSVVETWADAPSADGVASLKGWYASYNQPSGLAATGEILLRGDSGTTSDGRLYSYGSTSSSTDRALGSVRANTMMDEGGSVRFGVRFINRTGHRLTGFSLSYYGEQWRRSSASTVNYIDCSYTIFPTGGGTMLDTNSNYVAASRFSALKTGSYSGNLTGNDASNRTLMTTSVDNLTWEPLQELWIRWVTPNFSGSDAGLAIDDLTFTARRVIPPTPFEAYAKAHGLTGTEATPWAVLSNDGVPNVLKFALGAAPRNAAGNTLSPVTRLRTDGSGTFFTMTFSLGNAMNWDRDARALRGAGVVLWLEQSSDLAEWLPAEMVPSDASYSEDLALLPAATALEFRQETPLTSEVQRLFFRMRVETD